MGKRPDWETVLGLHQAQFGVALFSVGSKSDEVLAGVKIVLGEYWN